MFNLKSNISKNQKQTTTKAAPAPVAKTVPKPVPLAKAPPVKASRFTKEEEARIQQAVAAEKAARREAEIQEEIRNRLAATN
jgi:hypothetical protein